jgi:hypothetical protein
MIERRTGPPYGEFFQTYLYPGKPVTLTESHDGVAPVQRQGSAKRAPESGAAAVSRVRQPAGRSEGSLKSKLSPVRLLTPKK